MSACEFINTPDGRRIAYCFSPGREPGVVFLGGFRSDMTGTKAMALEAFCRQCNRQFVRFDYTGHGQSSGYFEDGTIGGWLEDAVTVLEHVAQGPQTLVGSSMGGWLMLLLARRLPKRVRALVGVASAPDFTEELIWRRLTDEQRAELTGAGVLYLPSCYGQDPYPITMRLIEESRSHLLLHEPVEVRAPVRLLHGDADEDVPWQISARLLERLHSRDAMLTVIKAGNHRLSEPAHLEILCGALQQVGDEVF